MRIQEQTTHLFLQARDGDAEAMNALLPHVYEQLYALAQRHQKRHFQKRLLDTTAIVHEVYLKIVDQKRVSVNDRAHFFALAARVVRQVLIDEARKRSRKKRGGDIEMVSLERLDVPIEERSSTLLAIDEALEQLALHNERMAQIVEYRFFVGLSVAEVAEVMGVSERTVAREWRRARAYLYQALRSPQESAEPEDPA